MTGTVTNVEGVLKSRPIRVHIPQEIDVKAIRAKLGMTQHEFAASFGFSIKTLQHWEQKHRAPEGPTRAYLLVIDRDPDAVQRALGSAT
jgi:putative transcriptional regulator